jgi:predicted aldo/keto reductase-like oxidoreductase
MEELLLEAVRSGHYDVIMPCFNFMKFPRIPEILREAHQKGVGVVAMKTLAGARDMDFDPGDAPFAPAAFKWVLKHSEVSGLVITIKTVGDLDLYLQASGKPFTAADQQVLNRYAERYGSEYCRTGCNACEARCPRGVEIATSMRYRMYFEDYGMEKQAMESYAALSGKASPCLDCSEAPCGAGCPYGLPVRDMLCEAHDLLSFAA